MLMSEIYVIKQYNLIIFTIKNIKNNTTLARQIRLQ